MAILVVTLLGVGACNRPPNLTPPANAAYTADQVVIRLGELQNAVIAATPAHITTADARVIVTWLSGDPAAVPPTVGVFAILGTVPDGWKATVTASWQTVRPILAANTTLAPWAPVVDALLQGVQ